MTRNLTPFRFVTAAALFDGHDASINMIRRLLQSQGAEVIHLGHNRSVAEVVQAAVQEDAHAIAISTYQGGHMEYFSYLLSELKAKEASEILVFGGGGGVILPHEIDELHQAGVRRIFSPKDGMEMGLLGMIQYMLEACVKVEKPILSVRQTSPYRWLARTLTAIEQEQDPLIPEFKAQVPVLGFTGTGGAGKSSLIDETLLRLLQVKPSMRIGILSVDPTRHKTGGALLGDRIRLNTLSHHDIYFRSFATRKAHVSIQEGLKKALLLYQNSGLFDLIILETAGIGQSDFSVHDLVDTSIYVMTPEFGAPSQLEKIAMLDYADVVVVNKLDKRGGKDALRDVRKAYVRNREVFDKKPEELPVFGTSAHAYGDLGTNRFVNYLLKLLRFEYSLPEGEANQTPLILPHRLSYLAEIAQSVRNYHQKTKVEADLAHQIQCITEAEKHLKKTMEKPLLTKEIKEDLEQFEAHEKELLKEQTQYEIRGKTFSISNHAKTLSGLMIPKIAWPKITSWAEQLKLIRLENRPGFFPYTAGVFPYKRENEDPTRMFAGEGIAERTNNRFHLLCQHQKAIRLSTAFDSVTLYGENPSLRPDIYGKIGNAGVSICSLDDMKRLYYGFDLSAPKTSVSMTINGPAPIILAFYLHAAIDFKCEEILKQRGEWNLIQEKIKRLKLSKKYRIFDLPQTDYPIGLGFLGVSARELVERGLYENIQKDVLTSVRGTVQADILKEDQAQNTCIFSTEFAMRMMGDVQQYFIDHKIRNFYSVSISGYHIAEAGANPVTQLAFTLANGFTLLEYYLSRGMAIDDFAPNLSFFFSNGLDAEYAVLGRVARRIWAIAMRDLYKGDERSQKLKYHIQTSGRSLHAQEMAFNDIRTTLQALYAILDNCNSLHTNAYDEAVTTPTEESVRRAVAIQMIINQELGWAKNQNTHQGSYLMGYLTDAVEEAVLQEFLSLQERGGVLGAMETLYQRSKIQEESLEYERQKHSGELPIVGVNTFFAKEESEPVLKTLSRSTQEEKQAQVKQVEGHLIHKGQKELAFKKLKEKAFLGENVFEVLMEIAPQCTLGEMTQALYEAGGAYRRNM